VEHNAPITIGNVASLDVECGFLPLRRVGLQINRHSGIATHEVAVAHDPVFGLLVPRPVGEAVPGAPDIAPAYQRAVAVFQEDGELHGVGLSRAWPVDAGDLHIVQPRVPGVAHRDTGIEAPPVETLAPDQQVLGVELPRMVVAGAWRGR